MKSYLSLAWKELKAQRVTSVLILLAVILSTIATTVMGQSVGILQTMRIEQASGLNGNRYATFHDLTKEQSDTLHADPRLKDVGSLMTVGVAELENSGLRLFLREYCGDALKAYPSVGKLREGRLPQRAGELALPDDAIQYLGIEGTVGEKVTIPLKASRLIDDQESYAYTADFILTGILESDYLGYAAGIVDGIAGEGTAQSLLPERYLRYSTDFKTVGTKAFQDIVDDLAGKLGIGERQVQYNWVLLDALGVDYAKKGKADEKIGFPFMMAACVLVGALILLAAGLVIYNILKVAVMKRVREYGTLRAMGSESGQLYRLVTAQLMILCGLGLPVGLLLGVLSTKGILTAAMGFLNPDLFMADTQQELNRAIAASGTGGPLPLLVSVAVTLSFAVLAAYSPARYAARVTPTVAMGGQAVKVKRRSRRARKIRHFERFYAGLNLKRNRSRTAITILSMVMSITVFVALQGVGSLLDAAREVKDLHTGDYSVANETVGIDPRAAAELADSDMVAELATTKLTVYTADENGSRGIAVDLELYPAETFQIAALDETRIRELARANGLSREDEDAILAGELCLAVNPIPITYGGETIGGTQVAVGDEIAVAGRKLRVAGIMDTPVTINNGGYLNGVQLVVPDTLYDALTGNDRYAEVFPTLKEGVTPEDFEDWLDAWCDGNPATHWLSYQQLDAQLSESYEQIHFLCWGLILFIGLIGILNIINTVYTNIHTRVNEIGMQRAVGMSAASLYKTFLWEGAYYGIIASGVGAVCGYVCTIFVDAAANGGLRLCAVPVLSILEAAVVSVAACLTATAVPLRGIGRMSIVESIETVE